MATCVSSAAKPLLVASGQAIEPPGARVEVATTSAALGDQLGRSSSSTSSSWAAPPPRSSSETRDYDDQRHRRELRTPATAGTASSATTRSIASERGRGKFEAALAMRQTGADD